MKDRLTSRTPDDHMAPPFTNAVSREAESRCSLCCPSLASSAAVAHCLRSPVAVAVLEAKVEAMAGDVRKRGGLVAVDRDGPQRGPPEMEIGLLEFALDLWLQAA